MADCRQYGRGRQEDFQVRELITQRIICCAEGFLVPHQVDYQSSRTYKEDFHQGVVNTDEVHEKVHVPHAKYQ